MPLVFLEQLPLPTLKSYVVTSVLLFVSAILYTLNATVGSGESDYSKIYDFVTQDNFCFWSNLNLAYCCLFLFGKVIQRVVFGDLRASELQQIQDRFWNFIFYKFIFIFGVLNVQQVTEIMWWTAWFTLLGFFHLFTQLCKDRFEYLSFSPTTTPWTHAKVIGLLNVLALCCNGLLFICLFVGWPDGIHTFTFMLAECMLLLIKVVHGLTRYGIHLWDVGHTTMWEGRSTWSYNTDLTMSVAMCIVDFAHHMHMLLWSNIFLSMASLVLCMQLRHLFYEIQKKLAKHRNYLRIIKCMESRFPFATEEQLMKNNDDCAICWDSMETARKLPCGHLFHNSCLRSWLENDTSCPTCRQSLASDLQPEQEDERQPRGMAAFMMGRGLRRNHFFHFDGSQIASWFPSFSVEVMHTRGDNLAEGQLPESRIEAMAHQVQAMFPHMPFNIIMDDLRHTHSLEITTDNILEGNIAVPSVWTPPDEQGAQEDSELLQIAQPSGEIESYPEAEERAPVSTTEDRQDTEEFEAFEEKPETTELQETRSKALENPTMGVIHRNASSPSLGFSSLPSGTRSTTGENPTVGVIRRNASTSSLEFSSLSSVRQSMLLSRKEEMLQQARRRFLDKEGVQKKESSD